VANPELGLTASSSTLDANMDAETPTNLTKKKRKKRKAKNKTLKPSKYADKCMYAELLEMRDEPAWDGTWGSQAQEATPDTESIGGGDGLPSDLETGFVAIAPVPAGKRCLVVSFQSSGVAGMGA
jgi:snurportin-1